MKTLLILLIAFSATAQEPLKYEGVVNVDSTTSANQLYEAAQIWFVKNFKDANSVIQIEDKTGGKIVGKGLFKVYGALSKIQSNYYMGDVSFVATVMVKDGRYKYEFSDFEHSYVKDNYYKYYSNYGPVYTTQNGFFKGHERSWTTFNDAMTLKINAIVISLKEAMSSTPIEEW